MTQPTIEAIQTHVQFLAEELHENGATLDEMVAFCKSELLKFAYFKSDTWAAHLQAHTIANAIWYNL